MVQEKQRRDGDEQPGRRGDERLPDASGELIAGNAFTRQYPGVGIGVSFAANSGRFAAETAASGL